MDIAIVSGTKYVDGALQAQIVLQGDGASCTPGLAYAPFGFKGRPRSPTNVASDGTVQDGPLALYYYEGNTLHIILLDDGARSTKLPELEEGGSQWYGDTDDAVSFYDGSGNLTMRAPKAGTVTIADKGSTVNIGDAPATLGDGSALNTAITALNALAAAMVALNPPSTPVTNATLNALGQTMQQILETISKIQTTELKAT